MINALKISSQIALLYLIYLLGSWIQQTFTLPIPGSIIGMAILFLLLLTKGMKETWVQDGAGWLMKHLVLFFIPATVGVMGYLTFFAGKGALLVVIVLVSTALVLIASGLIAQMVVQRKEVHHD